ncbi:MAG TPA: BrnT family toxin [Thermodesulfovibrionales bacterium]|nr:BrnT family toxin [Thermodesulfovibrionales bacterium]
MKVVWDTKKAAANIRKHDGIEFSHAATVLDDPMAVTIEDPRHGEQRFVTVGTDLLGKVLVVVYTYSGEEEIRLISARKASPKERRSYEEK